MPAALYGLVSSIIGDIILFIRLEKIASTHRVAALEKSLKHTHTQWDHQTSRHSHNEMSMHRELVRERERGWGGVRRVVNDTLQWAQPLTDSSTLLSCLSLFSLPHSVSFFYCFSSTISLSVLISLSLHHPSTPIPPAPTPPIPFSTYSQPHLLSDQNGRAL